MRDRSFPGRPVSLFNVLLLGIVGVALPPVLSWFATNSDLPVVAFGRDTITAGLGLYALVLIPTSIFAPAVGAMFPNYDRSTPVTLIRDSNVLWLLRLVAFGISFGGSVLAFDVPATLPVFTVFGLAVGCAFVLAMWLIQHSIAILDPDSLSAFLASRASRRPLLLDRRRPDPNQPFGDLCRLVRGYLNGQRPMAAAHGIVRMTEVWRVQGKRIDADRRVLASRVLGEAQGRDHWRPYLAEPIASFASVSGVRPDAESEAVARRKVSHEEPWLTKREDDTPSLSQALIRLARILLAAS